VNAGERRAARAQPGVFPRVSVRFNRGARLREIGFDSKDPLTANGRFVRFGATHPLTSRDIGKDCGRSPLRDKSPESQLC